MDIAQRSKLRKDTTVLQKTARIHVALQISDSAGTPDAEIRAC